MEGQAFGGHSELAMFDYEREYPLISHRMNDMFHHSPISCGKPTTKLWGSLFPLIYGDISGLFFF